MSNIHQVSTLDLPELEPYRTLRRPSEHIRQGIFVAEGEKVVRRLLASDLTIISMLMTPEWFNTLSNINHLTNNQLSTHHSTTHHSPKVFIADKQLLQSIVGFRLHQGIMAVAKVPQPCSLEEALSKVVRAHLLVALDGLVSAENVGVVVRNCVAFGVDAVIVGETSSSPYLRRAVRNSMGAIFQLAVVPVAHLGETITLLHQQYRTSTVAAHPKSERRLPDVNLSGNVCIVLGNEGKGLSRNVLEACTEQIAIPMMNGTDSINVASASAVLLYEARRQRGTLAKL